jgi:hypothetical protein
VDPREPVRPKLIGNTSREHRFERVNNSVPRGTLGVAGAAAICAYLLFFRVHDLDESFWMLSEQVRDWSVAQRPFSELPLAGPRSLNSGADIGPAYYWFLWVARVTLSPLLGPFPHTGGWAISLLHTAADFFLFVALWRRLESWPLAAAIVLLFGTSAHDASLTSTIWNPPLAVAATKFALAATLWRETPSTATATAAIVSAWLAVQMHVSAFVIALPITLWMAYVVGSSGDARRNALCGAALAASIALVVYPYSYTPVDRNDGGIATSISTVASNPFERIRLAESAIGILRSLDLILATPLNRGWFGWAIALGALVILSTSKLSALSACSTAIVATTVMLFSLWQGEFNQFYWFLVVAPSASICAFGALRVMKHRYRHLVASALILVVVLLQPARTKLAWVDFRAPAYGILRRAAIATAASGRPIGRITASFELPFGMDPAFLFTLAGGRLDPAARVAASIQRDGSVHFEP